MQKEEPPLSEATLIVPRGAAVRARPGLLHTPGPGLDSTLLLQCTPIRSQICLF